MIRISLERIAARLHSWRRTGYLQVTRLLSTPRYLEALYFVQAMSQQPGGLEKFIKAFLASSVEWEAHVSSGCEVNPFREYDAFEAHLQRWCEGGQVWDDDGLIELTGPEAVLDKGLFYGFFPALCRFMDDHAAAELRKSADTTLRRRVIFELDFARTASPPIPMVLVADTRHGKTTAVETYCHAWPGRARLVTLPESNYEREFYAAYAEAFGMDFTPVTRTRTLKERVQFTMRNTGIFCVHDESHFLIPTTYGKTSPPQRLNWIRAQIIDRHLPCAFFCTPQSQEETLGRYVERTHYNMEQWLGRMPTPVLIADKPTYEDLVSVARVHFAEFPQAALDELCDAADEKIESAGARLSGEGGFKIVELAGARARFLAAKRGDKVSIADIRQAVAWAGAPLPEIEPGRSPQSSEFPRPARGGLGRRAMVAEPPRRLRKGVSLVGAVAPGRNS